MAGRRGLAVAGRPRQVDHQRHAGEPRSATRRPAWAPRSRAAAAPAPCGAAGPGSWPRPTRATARCSTCRPRAAILLNVDHDHHATFATLEEVRGGVPGLRRAPPGRRRAGGRARRRGARLRAGRPVRGAAGGRRRRAPSAGPSAPRGARASRWSLADGRRVPVPAGRRRAPQRRATRPAPWRSPTGAACPSRTPPRAWPASPAWAGGWSARGARRRRRGGRRLRPPPGRDPGDPGRRPRARAPGAWWWCSSPTCPRAPGPWPPSWARPWAPPTWSW